MLVELSYKFINAIKLNHENVIQHCLAKYSEVSKSDISKALITDREKVAFWANTYNGWFQFCAQKKVDGHWKSFSNSFFKSKNVIFKDFTLSFDEIEHGILRRNQWKYGMGFVKKMMNSINSLAVQKVDYRVHFILNCGAMSCPLIVPLKLDSVENILEESMLIYMANEVITLKEQQKIEINKLFLYYLGDFGGKQKLKQLLFEKGIIKADALQYKWVYMPFNKSIKLANYRSSLH